MSSSTSLAAPRVSIAFPHNVVVLIKLVGRLFYRDEFVVVLDAVSISSCTDSLGPFSESPSATLQLAREAAIRDDSLEQLFALPEKQVRKILIQLRDEKLVCTEKVTERRVKKKGAAWGAARLRLRLVTLSVQRQSAVRSIGRPSWRP